MRKRIKYTATAEFGSFIDFVPIFEFRRLETS